MAEFFGLLGGGKGDGDLSGLATSALAILPATTHVGWAPPFHGIITRTQLLLPIINDRPAGLAAPARRALAGAGISIDVVGGQAGRVDTSIGDST